MSHYSMNEPCLCGLPSPGDAWPWRYNISMEKLKKYRAPATEFSIYFLRITDKWNQINLGQQQWLWFQFKCCVGGVGEKACRERKCRFKMPERQKVHYRSTKRTAGCFCLWIFLTMAHISTGKMMIFITIWLTGWVMFLLLGHNPPAVLGSFTLQTAGSFLL